MNNSTEQPSSWSGLNKDNYNHTEPNDPYFSAEQASKRGPELHPPGYNFLGPRTEFFARMIGSDFYKQMMINAGRKPVGTEPYNVPINELDRCAYEHDSVFAKNNNTEKNIRDADVKFRECASKIKDANLLYYIQIQLAKNAIGLKQFGEDIGVIKPELFAYINKSVNDINQTLAKNHTIPSTKEEQEKEDSNFWYAALMLFFRVGANTVLSGAQQIGTRELIKRTKNKNLINDINPLLRPFFTNTAEFFMSREQAKRIGIVIAGGGQTLINHLADSTNFFALGVYGVFLQSIIEKIGYDKLANLIMDNLLLKISTWFATDSWRERNIMTREELEQIVEGEDPAIHTATMKANTVFTKRFGIPIQNTRIREIVDIFNDNINNLSNREKIARFGNFNRAIIQLRNKLGPNESIFNVIYILLNGTIKNSLVADITVDRLRTILNQKISRDDFDTILSRNTVVENVEEYFEFPIDVYQNDTYMEFINTMLDAITTKNLGDLLS